MHKYKWVDLLALVISFICIASACNKSIINNNEDNNYTETKAEKIDRESTGLNSNNDTLVNKIEEKIKSSEKEQLKAEDFEVNYKNVIINKNIKVEDIIKELGIPEDYEANNQGYISGNAKYKIWNLCYPNYNNPEIQILVFSERYYVGEEVKDGDSYIVGVYLEGDSTNRGLMVGDELEKVLQLYGKSDSFIKDEDNAEGLYYLRYSKDSLNLDVTLDKEFKKVKYIFIDYNMKKSTNQQKNADN